MGMCEHPGVDELIILVERMGYGIEINDIGKFVEINPGDARNRKRQRFAGVGEALEFMRERERAVRSFG